MGTSVGCSLCQDIVHRINQRILQCHRLNHKLYPQIWSTIATMKARICRGYGIDHSGLIAKWVSMYKNIPLTSGPILRLMLSSSSTTCFKTLGSTISKPHHGIPLPEAHLSPVNPCRKTSSKSPATLDRS